MNGLPHAVVVAVIATALMAPSAIAQPSSSSREASPTHKKAPKRATTTPGNGRKALDSAPPIDVGDPRRAQAEQSAERDRLTARIESLRQQIAAGERSRSGATSALRRAERELADVNARLAELARRQREGQERIAAIDRQRTGTEGQIATRQAGFARTTTLFAANLDRDPTRIWLAGDDPGEPTLLSMDLRSAAIAQAADIERLHARAATLHAQRQRADDDNRALIAQQQTQTSTRDALAATHATQQKALAELSAQIAEKREAAARMASDEKRLARVVEQLQKAIDRQAAEERARREAARRSQEQQAARKERNASPKSRDATPSPPPTTIDAVPEDSPGHGAFAQLRGQLRLPVRGTLVGRFGAPRGTSGATWKGVFIRTEAGAEVRVVAPGKVVFAEDLRGFGNLVIVDHGDQYLSVYGNNQTLQKKSGDTVRAGDVIARAGNSGADDQTGLYFELRYRGQPFDPMTWSGAR